MKALVWIYVALILVFTLYGGLWSDMAHQGFAYNFGRALFWPVILFPSVGKAIGAVVLLGVIGWLTFFRRA